MRRFRTFQQRMEDADDPEFQKRQAVIEEARRQQNIRREIERFREEYQLRWAQVELMQAAGEANQNQYFAIPADIVYTPEAKEMLIKMFPLYVADDIGGIFDRITDVWMWPLSLNFVYGYKFRPTTGIQPKIVPGFSWFAPRNARRGEAMEIKR